MVTENKIIVNVINDELILDIEKPKDLSWRKTRLLLYRAIVAIDEYNTVVV